VIRAMLFGVLALWLLLPMTVGAAEEDRQQAPSQNAGVIQELDFGSQTLVIDGIRYGVAVDVKVEIAGSYGAFTMLEEGMRVYYEFQRNAPSSRIISLIRELPGDVGLDQV